MRAKNLFISLLPLYLIILIPFTSYLKGRPFVEKVGYAPEAEVLKAVAGDQQYLLAELLTLKAIFYYGTFVEKTEGKLDIPPEYGMMSKMLATAAKLDPYNMDIYYFSQAAFTWEVGWARDINKLLAYGMKYRTWDWYLPFFAGFNSAFFLKDFKSAAHYMQRAADLSGDPLLANLAARYYYEAGLNDLGIIFIQSMEKSAKDPKVKKVFAVRREALLAVKTIRTALESYRTRYNRLPPDIRALVSGGFLERIPTDPYGGEFYLTDKGIVRSTSKFAYAGDKQP